MITYLKFNPQDTSKVKVKNYLPVSQIELFANSSVVMIQLVVWIAFSLLASCISVALRYLVPEHDTK